ncbi:MAG: photosystem II protein Psb27 [Oscillatoriaceae bacterium SKW80]|nr:photosystem II protein Psb27 [Oscillatoriaceae bacterium SKYG93]MCX8119533.1 photosystem II protein Psb27 [Oscillatoriaceae bacterium SKW80]MDW8455000.1 photosystem II protein Psb27 [Oscillatoriaceae cyanobacterium SKYGB_i_bin93]HIK28224.1 photosystem II protein Psb27 [Oscillatoriaceae cyanobacterium M7585_C2015_266]
MKQYILRLLALVLVAAIALGGCTGDKTGLTGNYTQDTLTVINSLRTAINLPDGTPEKAEAQAKARQAINDFAARYQRDPSLTKLTSFTTMRTALNSLAAHYNSYPNRPLPQSLKERLEMEFSQVERALQRGA